MSPVMMYSSRFPDDTNKLDDVRPRYMAPMPSQAQKPKPAPNAASDMVSRELRELWLSLRNDATRIDEAKAIVAFCERVGLLTDVQRELWTRRVESCPGHADEGGRSWCAYCGNIPAEKDSCDHRPADREGGER